MLLVWLICLSVLLYARVRWMGWRTPEMELTTSQNSRRCWWCSGRSMGSHQWPWRGVPSSLASLAHDTVGRGGV
ncbi:hypothetical protein DFH08DRAFT_866233 [Mycena albidolilacea]|uniref:Secreted protein n=1 Tax=Mycena albidolilacea TaxID=1033008 RepID=A0AAD7A374_9AGAR|nr:hypothetical protein DFH08DRAFT_866233 [Mycena albidolilacea]